MNLANKLTMLRLLMVPVFIIVFNIYGTTNAIPAIVFALTAFTDFLDGYIARKYKLVTTFGKFMDPLVDKVLTQAGYVVLTAAGLIPAWVVIVIIFRELLITGLRTIAASNNVTIAASVYGKVKTITQFLAIIAYLLKGVLSSVPDIVFVILLYISVLTTIISGIEYLYKNKGVLDLDNI
ncbi:MAG: CDP-diacylglycerol--glycerol-3-phosphate 3-phosphatidyltransferase [Tissierellia bacterium]|nr:CDP-diacylglycerol--glycerol-3-phosphate 3-phosphatidyltransferase [Tissierellia bacterium]